MPGLQTWVGMSEIHVQKGPTLFTCAGLASCIGLVAYDPLAKVGGMAHIMLPESFPEKPTAKPGQFANTAIPALLDEMERLGASPTKLIAAYAGGAQVFRFGAGKEALGVGARNAAAVAEWVRKYGLKVVAEDVGGNLGRTLTMCTTSGDVKVHTVDGVERVLCNVLQEPWQPTP